VEELTQFASTRQLAVSFGCGTALSATSWMRRRMENDAGSLFAGVSISKWTVKPHQRELLADKIMQLDADQQERSAEEHILANREGAIGGTGTSGGGCGCN